MIAALLNQKGGVGKAAPAQHLAGQWDRQGKRITPIGVDQRASPATGLSSVNTSWPRGIARLAA